jgi:hypothetical protein
LLCSSNNDEKIFKVNLPTTTDDDDDDSSNELHPVVSSIRNRNVTESIELKANGRITLVNGRIDAHDESIKPSKSHVYTDPWIRRTDQLPSIYAHDLSTNRDIQYETRHHYHCLSSTTDDHQLEQQHCPLITPIDKDIEYVESRLRGQTAVVQSMSPSTSTSNTTNDQWRISTSHDNYQHADVSSYDRQQMRPVQDKYSNIDNTKPFNETIELPPKSILQKSQATVTVQNQESVKTVKNRMEKMKDQKAAKTLRFLIVSTHNVSLLNIYRSSAILIAFIVTWLPYNTNIIISTIKPDIFQHGFPMYWERFGYMLCYINSTIKFVTVVIVVVFRFLFRIFENSFCDNVLVAVQCSMHYVMAHFDEHSHVYFVVNAINDIQQLICKRLIVFKPNEISRIKIVESSNVFVTSVDVVALLFQ